MLTLDPARADTVGTQRDVIADDPPPAIDPPPTPGALDLTRPRLLLSRHLFG
ncbi:MAG: hypothetical protein M1370_01960 [Bacteroidetes bacterium]|nr:hypothetical protein [Bacteroidota bacterium]